MRQESGRIEFIHEFLVDIQFQISQLALDLSYSPKMPVVGENQGCSFQGTVAQYLKDPRIQVRQHADGDGRFRVDKGAKGSGHKKSADILKGNPHRVGKNA